MVVGLGRMRKMLVGYDTSATGNADFFKKNFFIFF